ncbi:uncharacterized protein B0H64DRAFT_2471 [Chaetomium fimeti]|uniref:SRR1-like domain-containing protein n=1 Tax=Chaetomium fimeti TaxID=1854472 RepID=A0AAE0HNL9_9PEZI|nr:hypothetical protein B0H64DRAFT_2471 [Chaetomium fimeti]
MPYYPLPIPSHVIDEIENEERQMGVPEEEIERWAGNRATIHGLCGPINAIYESGTPLFTKAAIRDLVREIDESGMRRIQTAPLSLHFSITGIDGRTVDFPIQLGVKHPLPPHWPQRADGSVLMDAMLFIDLRPADYLTSTAFINVHDFDHDKAFLPITVRAVPIPIHPGTGEPVPQPPLPRSAPETLATLQQAQAQWNSGAACRELVATLHSAAEARQAAGLAPLPHVDKVVAFACNQLSTTEDAGRVAAEHALVLSLRDFFTTHTQRRDPETAGVVRCYAQDPAYQDVDRAVLAEVGVTVLDHPRGFLEVDESAVVFSLAPDVAVRQVVADLARPAVMVWNRVREIPREGDWVGRAERADNISPRVEEMIKDYTEFPFPADLAGFGSSLAIYVRNY